MTDIFREVEEDVRRERFELLWKKYGDYVIAGAALIVIAAAGLQLWRVYEQRQAVKASETYVAALQMLLQGQSSLAGTEFDKLVASAPGGYAKLSQLQKANALLASGNVPEAVDIYKQVAAKDDPVLGPVARIRAAWALVETSPRGDIATLVQPLSDSTSPWHPLAREILAYADYRAGDTAKALAEYRAVAKDPAAPSALRERCDAMATFLAAGGDKEFGTVPPPKPEPANPTGPAQGAPQQ